MIISKQTDKQLVKLYRKPLSDYELMKIRRDGGGVNVIFGREEIAELRQKSEKKSFNPKFK